MTRRFRSPSVGRGARVRVAVLAMGRPDGFISVVVAVLVLSAGEVVEAVLRGRIASSGRGSRDPTSSSQVYLGVLEPNARAKGRARLHGARVHPAWPFIGVIRG